MHDELLQDAASRAAHYLHVIQERQVGVRQEDLERLDLLREPLPEGATDPREALRLLDEIGSPSTIGMAGPRFFGFVIGGSLPQAVAANWLATAWDQNTGYYRLAPITSAAEEISLAWLLDLFDLPRDAAAGFVTGATSANFTALAAARHALLRRAGWDVEANGLFGAPEVTVVMSAESHPSVAKALGLLGFGRKRVVAVPTDAQGRMRADSLPDARGPVLICAQAGNVNTGSCDPLADIAEWANERGAWMHVDGAFGLWAAAVPSRRGLVDGYQLADSWATDLHKWLNVPYDSGIAFVRDEEALRLAMSITAAYLPQPERREPAQYTPELSRRGRGVEIWMALKTLGRSGVAEMIDRCCRHATRFAEGLRSAGFPILNDVALNQVLVSFGDAAATERTIAAIQDDGTCWCGGTVWQGQTAMRISVSSWATTEEDVERSLEAMIRCARIANA